MAGQGSCFTFLKGGGGRVSVCIWMVVAVYVDGGGIVCFHSQWGICGLQGS